MDGWMDGWMDLELPLSGHTPWYKTRFLTLLRNYGPALTNSWSQARHSQEHQLCQPAAVVWVPESPQLVIDTVGGFAIPRPKPDPHFTAGYAGEGADYRWRKTPNHVYLCEACANSIE